MTCSYGRVSYSKKLFALWDRETERGNGYRFRLSYIDFCNRMRKHEPDIMGDEFYEKAYSELSRKYGRLEG